MHRIICILCGNNQYTTELYHSTLPHKGLSASIYSARRMPDRVHYRILRCQKCSLIFSSPIYPLNKIQDLYQESVCTYGEEIPYLQKVYFQLFQKVAHDVSGDDPMLEIGCGNGFFLSYLREKGYTNLFGVEPSKKMVAKADKHIKKHIVVDIFKKNLFPKNTFKVIFIFHTLDHIVNLKEVVSEMKQVLKKGGYVIAVVHDTEGLSVRLFGEKSPIFDVEHIYLFNKRTLAKLFERNGFQITTVSAITNTYPFIYWFRMSPIHRNIKQFLIPFLNKTHLAHFPTPIPAGNISIIAQK